MTWIELVRDEAKKLKRTVTDEQADYILWEHTGFPEFWQGDPETCCREQVREFFESEKPKKGGRRAQTK